MSCVPVRGCAPGVYVELNGNKFLLSATMSPSADYISHTAIVHV